MKGLGCGLSVEGMRVEGRALTREAGSRFRPPPEAEVPNLLKTKLFTRS